MSPLIKGYRHCILEDSTETDIDYEYAKTGQEEGWLRLIHAYRNTMDVFEYTYVLVGNEPVEKRETDFINTVPNDDEVVVSEPEVDLDNLGYKLRGWL